MQCGWVSWHRRQNNGASLPMHPPFIVWLMWFLTMSKYWSCEPSYWKTFAGGNCGITYTLLVQVRGTVHCRFRKEGSNQLNFSLSSVSWRMRKVWCSFLMAQTGRATRNTSGCEFYTQIFLCRYKSLVLIVENNVPVSSEELIGTTEYSTL